MSSSHNVGDAQPATTVVTNHNFTTVVNSFLNDTILFSKVRQGMSDTTLISTTNFQNSLDLDMSLQIALYVTIFLLGVIGNSLVILTLLQNKGMRTITNLFLLNLAISDLFVGVLCMPFSLVGVILKDFRLGPILCKLIPYLQAVSVSVSAWTLVTISVERYYAICYPLTSRRWQTLSHAYKMIGIIWSISGFSMTPIPIVNTLQPIRDTGRHKCREEWSSWKAERAYTIFLDMILLVLPLGIMTIKYTLITRILWNVNKHGGSGTVQPNQELMLRTKLPTTSCSVVTFSVRRTFRSPSRKSTYSDTRQNTGPTLLRRCNVARSLKRKKRVIQMLGVVVTEFFVCWTPLYVMNTWYVFSPSEVYETIGPLGVSLVQLLSYLSSCVNPITYCFMNRGFRMAFCHLFGCPTHSPPHLTFTSCQVANKLNR